MLLHSWNFEDLNGTAYTADTGSMDRPAPGKMVWTKSRDPQSTVAPFYFPDETTSFDVNVYARAAPSTK